MEYPRHIFHLDLKGLTRKNALYSECIERGIDYGTDHRHATTALLSDALDIYYSNQSDEVQQYLDLEYYESKIEANIKHMIINSSKAPDAGQALANVLLLIKEYPQTLNDYQIIDALADAFERNTGRVLHMWNSTDPDVRDFYMTITPANTFALRQHFNHDLSTSGNRLKDDLKTHDIKDISLFFNNLFMKTKTQEYTVDSYLVFCYSVFSDFYDQYEVLEPNELKRMHEGQGGFFDYTIKANEQMMQSIKDNGELNTGDIQLYSDADYEAFNIWNNQTKNRDDRNYIEDGTDFKHFSMFGNPQDMTVSCLLYALWQAGADKVAIWCLWGEFDSNSRLERKRTIKKILDTSAFKDYMVILTVLRSNGNRVNQAYPKGAKVDDYQQNHILRIGLIDNHYFAMKDIKYANGQVLCDSFDFINKIIHSAFTLRHIDMSNSDNYDLFSGMLLSEFYQGINKIESSSIIESKEFEITYKTIKEAKKVNSVIELNKDWMSKINEKEQLLIKQQEEHDKLTAAEHVKPSKKESELRIWTADTETGKCEDDMYEGKMGIQGVEKLYQYSITKASSSRDKVCIFDRKTRAYKKISDFGKLFESYFLSTVKKEYLTGPTCDKAFAQSVAREKPDIVYFHNIKFDISNLLKELILQEKKEGYPQIIRMNGNIYCIEFSFCKFIDSYKLISMPLRNFSRSFGLTAHKEWINYDWFNDLKLTADGHNFAPLFVNPIKKSKKGGIERMPKANMDLARKNGWINKDGLIDAFKYSQYYCMIDCDVLAMGIFKFADALESSIGLNFFDYLTISGLADSFFKATGCYEKVHETTGICGAFVQHTIRGGFCTPAFGKKWFVKAFIDNLDANSLYPSAMRRMRGFPTGPVKQIPIENRSYKWLTTEYIEADKGDHEKTKTDKNGSQTFIDGKAAWLKVRFIKVLKEDPFNWGVSICACKEEGKVSYECKPNKDYMLTLIDVMELVKYHCVAVEDIVIVDGYYSEGFNTRINTYIKVLFDIRAAMKKAGNPCQEIIKLIINSAYGKSILKANKYGFRYINSNRFASLIRNANSAMESAILLGVNSKGHQVFEEKVHLNLLDHSNYAVVGSYVLSYSKVIMNEAHNALFEASKREKIPLNIPTVFYRDTDSLQILERLYKPFREVFNELYGKDPIGRNLGQFKNDYTLDSKENKMINERYYELTGHDLEAEGHAVLNYWITRKVYMSHVEFNQVKAPVACPEMNLKAGDTFKLYDTHGRHKGIPSSTLENAAYKQYQGQDDKQLTLDETFINLLNGQSVVFDLKEDNLCLINRFGNPIYIKEQFTRTSLVEGAFITVIDNKDGTYNVY